MIFHAFGLVVAAVLFGASVLVAAYLLRESPRRESRDFGVRDVAPWAAGPLSLYVSCVACFTLGSFYGMRMAPVVVPVPESPAERAGIVAGDRVLRVGTTSVTDYLALFQELRSRGAAGEEVRLEIARQGTSGTLSFAIRPEGGRFGIAPAGTKSRPGFRESLSTAVFRPAWSFVESVRFYVAPPDEPAVVRGPLVLLTFWKLSDASVRLQIAGGALSFWIPPFALASALVVGLRWRRVLSSG